MGDVIDLTGPQLEASAAYLLARRKAAYEQAIKDVLANKPGAGVRLVSTSHQYISLLERTKR